MRISEEDPGVPPLDLEPLRGAGLAAWPARTREEYIAERREAGDSEAEASAQADECDRPMFPAGTPAPGQLVGLVEAAGGPVGHLWVGPVATDPARWWVWDVAIQTPDRGRGYGRAAMMRAERRPRARGATTIGLNVLGHNHVARQL